MKLPRARLRLKSLPGKPCGKSFIPGKDNCTKAVQSVVQFAAGKGPQLPPINTSPKPPRTPAKPISHRAAIHKQHYLQHRTNPTVSNAEILDGLKELSKLPGTNRSDVLRVVNIIRKSRVQIDYSVFDRAFKPGSSLYREATETPYLGVHYDTLGIRGLPLDLAMASSIIYVRPTGNRFVFLPDQIQHTVGKAMDDIAVADTFNRSRPGFTAGDMTLELRTPAQEGATLLHELGHVVHARTSYFSSSAAYVPKEVVPFLSGTEDLDLLPSGARRFSTRSKSFTDQSYRTMSRYALSDFKRDRSEFFAESFVLYLAQGQRFRQAAPLTYSWVHDIIMRAGNP